MSENPESNVKYAHRMTRSPFLLRLRGIWEGSFVIQLVTPILIFVATVSCAQIFFIIGDYNPRHVGGEKCQFPDAEIEYTLVDGKPVQVASVDEQWRMTRGNNRLVLLETGQGSETFEIYLPQGRYNLAYRYITRPYYYDHFTITLVSPDGSSRAVVNDIMKLLDSSWVADWQRFSSTDGIYEFRVDAPGRVNWCLEIGHPR